MVSFPHEVIAGLSAVSLVWLGRIFIDRIFKGRKREIIVSRQDGKQERINISSDADTLQIADSVRQALAFEDRIADALQWYAGEHRETKLRRVKAVDFIVEGNGKKIAIEVKNSLDGINDRHIEKYLNAEPGIQKLIIVSHRPATVGRLEKIRKLSHQGIVSIIEIPPSEGRSAELLKALHAEFSNG